MMAASPASAQYLVGNERAEFIRGVLSQCNGDLPRDPELKVVPAQMINDACKCYASRLADTLTKDQMQKDDQAVIGPVIKRSMKTCYDEVKADFIRRYNYGK